LKADLPRLEAARKALRDLKLSTRDVDAKITSVHSQLETISDQEAALAKRARFRVPLFPLDEFRNSGDFLKGLQIDESKIKPYELGKTVVAKLEAMGKDNPYPGLLRDIQLLEKYIIIPGHDAAVRHLIDQRIQEATALRPPSEAAVLIGNFVRPSEAHPVETRAESYKSFLERHKLTEQSFSHDFIVELRSSGEHPHLLKQLADLAKDPRYDSYLLHEKVLAVHHVAQVYFGVPESARKGNWAEKALADFDRDLRSDKEVGRRREQRVEGIERRTEKERERRQERDRENRRF
jgi:hypothetical protein